MSRKKSVVKFKMIIPTEKIDINDLVPEELEDWLESRGVEPYRAGQIWRWVYARQADCFNDMTDIRKDTRRLLSDHYRLNRLARIKVQRSADGTCKYLFKLDDGYCIESVLIPERDHLTLCISTQVGCAQGCRFCLTAHGGLVRNLTKNEIISQVRDILRDSSNDSRPLTNIVMMGMGEPLANYNNVLQAISVFTSRDIGLGFANRRITLSTSGLVPGINRLGRDCAINLAVSLNATDNPTRDMLMPVNRRYPIGELLEACRNYPLKPHRRITFEYILIKGVNDSPADAGRLANLLQPIRSKINLIPFNMHEASDFKPSPESTILMFQKILLKKNFTVIIRRSKGGDISAACGQLRAQMSPWIETFTTEKPEIQL